MKSLISVIFILLLAASAFAGEGKPLQGLNAEQMLNALTRADAYISCTTMPCSTIASEISCSTLNPLDAECTLNVQSDEKGTMVRNHVTGDRAQELATALKSAGIINSNASRIHCTLLNPEAEMESTSQCVIDGVSSIK